jgi:hypothetical protein
MVELLGKVTNVIQAMNNEDALAETHLKASRTCREEAMLVVDGARLVCPCGWSIIIPQEYRAHRIGEGTPCDTTVSP